MNVVIDASAAIAWCLPDEFDEGAEALLAYVVKHGAIIPSLWVVEMENALRNAHRRKRLSAHEAAAIFARLAALPLRIVDAYDSPVFHQAFALSIEHDISVYDAIYLDASKRHTAAFSSRDKRLLKVAASMNLPIANRTWLQSNA